MEAAARIIINTISEYATYRVNFLFWRFRMVVQLLMIFFFWSALFQQRQGFFRYDQATLLTYILVSAIIRSIVLATTTMEVGTLIQTGALSQYLLKPMSVFKAFAARDVADKLLNILCAGGELALLLFILRPVLVLPSTEFIPAGVALILMATALYFCISMLLSMLGFWTSDLWAPRFVSFVIIDFFAGGYFPIDILPDQFARISAWLPFQYLLYFPAQVLLGRVADYDIALGFLIMVVWLGIVALGVRTVWRRGLRIYAAEGR